MTDVSTETSIDDAYIDPEMESFPEDKIQKEEVE